MGRHKKEVWKWIDLPNVKPNYYKISSWGNVVNKNGKKMKYETDKNGYKRYNKRFNWKRNYNMWLG